MRVVCRISSSAMLSEAAERMRRCGNSSLPVVENRRLVGRVTQRDIARAVSTGWNPNTTPVKYVCRGDACVART
jgi:CBS domain-containing protein